MFYFASVFIHLHINYFPLPSFFPETWCYTPYETPRLHCGDGHLCAAQMRNEGSSSSVCSNTPTARGWRKCKPRVARLGGRRDGQWDEGKSVSPGQPITSDPTPTKKGWRDERMDGDDDGGGGVGKKDESDKEEEQRHGKIQQYKKKREKTFSWVMQCLINNTIQTGNCDDG